jgi:hypothetical protein
LRASESSVRSLSIAGSDSSQESAREGSPPTLIRPECAHLLIILTG